MPQNHSPLTSVYNCLRWATNDRTKCEDSHRCLPSLQQATMVDFRWLCPRPSRLGITQASLASALAVPSVHSPMEYTRRVFNIKQRERMKKTRKCAFCGKEFTANSGMQKYCSVRCADEAKKAKKKRQQDFLNAVEPVLEIQRQEYLTFSKAAILMGCSRQYIYKLVSQGKLKASRISSRMSFIRRTDIEAMLEGNPYNRLVFGSRPKKATSKQAKKEVTHDEPLAYISGEEVLSTYKVKQSWLYTTAKRNQIPICKIAGKNYYSKSHVEECLGLTVDIASITDWLTTGQVFEVFGMSATAIHAYAYRHSIPTKKEYGTTYYSKTHLAELRQTDLMSDERFCTVDEVSEKYGLSKANIHHITKVHGIEKKKVGVKNLLLRADVERAMAERAAKGL